MAPLCSEESNAAFYGDDESSSSTTMQSSSTSLLSSSLVVSSSPMTPKTRRSVTFSAGAAVHLGAVINIGDYSEDEKCYCWLQPDEMREIRREVKETVALMNNNISINDTAYETMSTHGLEGKTKSGKRDRKKIRLASLAAVFDEQALQEMDGICDPNLIAIAYAECCFPMQVAAFVRASEHRKETFAYYENDINKDNDDIKHEHPLASNDTSSFVGAELLEEPTKNTLNGSTPEESFPNGLNLDDLDDINVTPLSASNDKDTTFGSADLAVSNKIEETENLETVDNDNSADLPYNTGAFKIRNRFAWLAFQ